MRWSPAIVLLLPTAMWAADAASQYQIDDGWKAERWNKTEGTLAITPDGPHAPHPQGTITAVYKGTGFEWFVVNPASVLSVPNAATTVSLWAKGGAAGYPIVVKFQDMKGKQAGGKDLEWIIPGGAAEWQQRTFTIPAEWSRPVSVYAIAVHNWDHQAEAAKITYHVSELSTAP